VFEPIYLTNSEFIEHIVILLFLMVLIA
jgi:hypothetical protein